MALTSLQNTEQLLKDIQDLSKDLENLRKIYEQYFMGLVREEPVKLREQIKSLIQRNSGITLKNAMLKFQLQQCIARYNTYSTYWDRVLKQMEEGTYQRDVFRTHLHEKERDEKKATPKQTKSPSSSEQNYENLFEEYKNLKKNLKHDVSSLSFDKFQSQLKKTMSQLKNTEGKKINFKIEQQGNEIKIKLVAKKDKPK